MAERAFRDIEHRRWLIRDAVTRTLERHHGWALGDMDDFAEALSRELCKVFDEAALADRTELRAEPTDDTLGSEPGTCQQDHGN